MMRILGIVWFVLFGTIAIGWGQTADTLRVSTYNLLNYPNNSTARNPEFRKILRAIDPDVLVIQEMQSANGMNEFLSEVLNYGRPGTYSMAPFNDGYDTDNGMFYKSARVQFIGPQTILQTETRDINGYRLRPAGFGSDSMDFRIYSAHLRASQGQESARFAEADTLRNHLNSLPDGHFIAAGDFNLYTSNEPAWVELTGSQADNSGRLYDPINQIGSWHDAPSFAAVHTQSTRFGDQGDGGASGGMDDRFDFALLTYNFQSLPGWQYVSGSYTAYGNDGNHFDQSINDGVNGVVPDSIADALHFASDHLPVFLRIRRLTTPPPTVTLLSPNGSEIWYVGSSYSITWTSLYLTGNVTLKLNRSYPLGTWQTILSGTPNDGQQTWLVTLPPTDSARIQIVSDSLPTVNDLSNANFSLRSPSITVISPDGGEVWRIGQVRDLQWTSAGISGNVKIELDRMFPSGGWEILYASTPNDGLESWSVTYPSSEPCRIRISSVAAPTIGDTSNASFAIQNPDALPTIEHDPHGDAYPGPVTFTAQVVDDHLAPSCQLFYRAFGAFNFDSLAMPATGLGSEYAETIILTYGYYQYILRATDSAQQTAQTDTFEFSVAAGATRAVSYDDGTAEVYNWSSQDFAWAVKFTPPGVPFVLSEVSIAVAGFHPDSTHEQLRVKVLFADGPWGLPGLELVTFDRGSVGNVVGGLPSPGTYWARVILTDPELSPVELTDDFYIAVENIGPGAEAFGLDTSSPSAERSCFFDPCVMEWFSESEALPNARNGNRMIRVKGWVNEPTTVVIHRDNNEIRLHWSATGAPYYIVYGAPNSSGPFEEVVASISDTTAIVASVGSAPYATFYRVVSSSAPQ